MKLILISFLVVLLSVLIFVSPLAYFLVVIIGALWFVRRVYRQ